MEYSESEESKRGPSPLRLWGRGITAQNIMTPNPITVSPQDTIEEAANLLYTNDIRHLPVVDQEKLIGVLSERDLRGYTRSISELINDPGGARIRLQALVRSIYSSDFIALGAEAELDEIVERFVEEKVGAIPIVRSRDFRLIGIVSYIDVLKQIQSLSELSALEARKQ